MEVKRAKKNTNGKKGEKEINRKNGGDLFPGGIIRTWDDWDNGAVVRRCL